MNNTSPDRLYIAVRADMSPGLQIAQASHAAFHFSQDWPSMVGRWMHESNFLVVVAVPNEAALFRLAQAAAEEGIVYTRVREPDLGDTVTAVALQPGPEAKRLCARIQLALKEPAMT